VRKAAFVVRAALVWDPALAAYDLGDHHPLNPVRLTLTTALIAACGILDHAEAIAPRIAPDREIALVHSTGYIEAVRESSDWGAGLHAGMGLGTDDNPIYPGMHDIAALNCGASIAALEVVLEDMADRTFSIAGGMHHAHRARAAGFSVYNDAAVAIAVARSTRPDLRVLYIDIDAHHGDGVQEAFYGSADVMTISIHETGLQAFPGTGFPGEMGYGDGLGYAVNVPMPPFADDECYRRAFDETIAPIARAFAPDIIVAQLGADAHHADPQTELSLTLPGYRDVVRRVIGLADELCGGKLVALGGGGYHVLDVVPLAWTWVMAELAGIELPDETPVVWRDHVRATLGDEPPVSLSADPFALCPEHAAAVLEETEEVIREVRETLFPLHGLTP
jgi:acetoin utilization protein AcuC